MKHLYIMSVLLVLAGCYSGPTAEQIATQDDSYCRSMGLSRGTEAYANCRMQRTNLRLALLNSEPRIGNCHTYGTVQTCF